jgi:hypothetical protein
MAPIRVAEVNRDSLKDQVVAKFHARESESDGSAK